MLKEWKIESHILKASRRRIIFLIYCQIKDESDNFHRRRLGSRANLQLV